MKRFDNLLHCDIRLFLHKFQNIVVLFFCKNCFPASHLRSDFITASACTLQDVIDAISRNSTSTSTAALRMRNASSRSRWPIVASAFGSSARMIRRIRFNPASRYGDVSIFGNSTSLSQHAEAADRHAYHLCVRPAIPEGITGLTSMSDECRQSSK